MERSEQHREPLIAVATVRQQTYLRVRLLSSQLAALTDTPFRAVQGPWKRLATLRNGSHIETLCQKKKCAVPCRDSCCSGTKDEPSFVTWAPTLIHAPSSVNASGKDVWNLFYSSNQVCVAHVVCLVLLPSRKPKITSHFLKRPIFG